MSAPFAPGDVVVCVDASRTLFHAGESSRTAPYTLQHISSIVRDKSTEALRTLAEEAR